MNINTRIIIKIIVTEIRISSQFYLEDIQIQIYAGQLNEAIRHAPT